MKYNKKQRHKIYKKAHELSCNGDHRGNCWVIYDAISREIGNESNYVSLRHFPELIYMAPIDNIRTYNIWFENETLSFGYLLENHEHRKTILEFCIEMTR